VSGPTAWGDHPRLLQGPDPPDASHAGAGATPPITFPDLPYEGEEHPERFDAETASSFKRHTGTLRTGNLLNETRIEASPTRHRGPQAAAGRPTARKSPGAAHQHERGAAASSAGGGRASRTDPGAATTINNIVRTKTDIRPGPKKRRLPPHIFNGVRDVEGVITWTDHLTGQTAGIDCLAVAGITSRHRLEYRRAEKSDPATVTTTAFGAAVSRVVAIDAANIIAIGASGTVRTSEDGGLSWTALISGVTTALNSIAVRSLVDWWIGGATGTLLHYYKGTITAIADPTGGDTLTTLALPDDRDDDVYLGTSTGEVFYTQDGGDTWAEYRFPGDNAGSGPAGLRGLDGAGAVHRPQPGCRFHSLAARPGGGGRQQQRRGHHYPGQHRLQRLPGRGANDALLVGDAPGSISS
jgi:photosystem II stability/assembly factor-like uncharacterized protein